MKKNTFGEGHSAFGFTRRFVMVLVPGVGLFLGAGADLGITLLPLA